LPRTLADVLKHNLRQALRDGRLDDARAILARLQKEDSLSCEARGLELEFYLRTNRTAEAAALAAQLCELFPGSGRVFYLAGQAAYRQRRYAEAEARFRESLRIYPGPQARHWLGKTLTQLGRFEEAEAQLMAVKEQIPQALLDLAWLHERRGDLSAALAATESFLALHPDHEFAAQQRVRLKAMLLDPEALIAEVESLQGMGESVPEHLFPGYVRRLFETGLGPRAREEIGARMRALEPRTAVQVAWICYRAQAYDLACALFLERLEANAGDVKYLRALEAAARRSGRLEELKDTYRRLAPHARNLYGRLRALSAPDKP